MDFGIDKAVKDGNGNALVFTALLAAAIANSLPTPFDSIYFSRQQKLKSDLEDGKITVENYWWHDTGEYYLWTSLWYVSLLAVVAAMGGTYKTNARILIALASGGLVVGVVAKNIKKDKEIAELRKQQGKPTTSASIQPNSNS